MQLRFRQVHLDFHTSPDIPGIGAAFDAAEFAATLEKASVNSITSFARCHHGWLYYDSKAHPERVHPNLSNKNLLPAQIMACHAKNIRVPIYTTVQWDDYTAERHPEWLMIEEDGRQSGTKPFEPGFYRVLDVFHPGYRQFLFDHVKDLFACVPEVDGLFFDIVGPRVSFAPHWIAALDAAGLNPQDASDRQRFATQVIQDWQAEMTAFVRKLSLDCTIFYNSGHVGTRHRSESESYTHWELESLPSGGWGYLHFPQAQRYARTLGLPCLGMTGKFHTSWGDFHSFKNPAALEFECFHMLALTAQCSIGDQLHPSGKIDAATYDLIGGVYGQVKAKEPWCVGATPVTDVALMTSEEFTEYSPHSGRNLAHIHGGIRMLQELGIQFDIIDSQSDWMRYKLLILPDEIPFDTRLSSKLDAFVYNGGTVIASYKSGLGSDGQFVTGELGVKAIGDAPFSPDFIVPGNGIGDNLPKTGHVMYQKALEVTPANGGSVLCWAEVPYFNRTWRHFCSHAHTPSSGERKYPAVVASGAGIYFAHPIFRQYQLNAPLWVKTLLKDAIEMLLPRPVLSVKGPSSLLATLNRQEAESRHIVHLLHYIPERRGQALDVIEDVIPVHNIEVTVRLGQPVSAVKLVPDGAALAFTVENGAVKFTVPTVNGHAMVEVK
ncbi:alpha-amylase family protein [Armatimonas sp.]|uniref:alpha-amylase family protein n=1 Tax=Armatimonas sp. TaxID=1872638 RepID=UPI003751119F